MADGFAFVNVPKGEFRISLDEILANAVPCNGGKRPTTEQSKPTTADRTLPPCFWSFPILRAGEGNYRYNF